MKKIISVTQEHPMVALASDITYMQKSFWCGCSAYPLKLSFMRARHRYAFDPEHENYPLHCVRLRRCVGKGGSQCLDA